ncbi:MAG TPA: hypothetical protein VK866_15365 [Acidimicrobiales bacterium]|nr:hypothetical protein [Acidimicrobiales bacterium]
MSAPARPRKVLPLVLAAIALVVFVGGAILLARWRLLMVPLAVAAVWALDRTRRMQ